VRDAVVVVLVGAGMLLQVLASAGVLLMRNPYDRLHYNGAAMVGAMLTGAGVLVREGPSLIGTRAVLLAVFLLVSGPVVAHVTARAIAAREGR